MNKNYGLTTQQANENTQKYGNNKLSVKESQTIFEMFVDTLKDVWVLILIGALILKTLQNFYSMKSGIGEVNWMETVGLFVAIALVSIVSTYTNYKNEKAFSNLQDEASKIDVKVYRDGKIKEINIDNITKGDAILLQAGDKVPVDGFILSGKCKVNQASLNGESEDATKVELGNNSLPDSSDLFTELKLFRGSVVTSGEVVMEATELGDATVMGSINTALQEDKKQSPSAAKLEKLAKFIGVMGYTVAGFYALEVIALELVSGSVVDWIPFIIGTIMYAVTIIIMAVPEGLPMMMALVASMNSGKMLSQNILVRNTESIETAGYLTTLFSDKTGTITEGQLSVVEFIQPDGTTIPLDQINSNTGLANEIIKALALNNDSMVSDGKAIGSNGTDRAILEALIKTSNENYDKSSIVDKEQFDSAKKYASVTTDDGTKYIKGAPEFILNNVTKYVATDGSLKPFDENAKQTLDELSIQQANRAMRILAIIKEVNGETVFITGVSIRDNVRQGMSNTVDILNKAGVQVVMVTGDRKETAIAIAKEANIFKPGDVAITSEELNKMTDKEVKEILPKLKVVSRALPLDKKRLVNLAQELDEVVGMTGDGVNDSPALKSADVGFSMGDGTATAQEASDIVILNNSLSSIEKAVMYGRTMTLSVQKFIIFQLTVNVATLLISILGPIFNFHEPFTVIQILWINLVMDTLAAIAFGGEPALDRYMLESPIHRNDNILTGYMKKAIGLSAVFISLITVGILANIGNVQSTLGLHSHNEVGTFIFTFFIYSVLFNGFNTRSKNLNLFEHIGENPKFIFIMSIIAIVQTLIIQFGGAVFSTVPMDMKHYIMALGLAFLIIPMDMIRKLISK